MLYQTHVRIHINNIRSNIEGIRRAIGPQRNILISVKANAYGHGAVEISRLAESVGVNWLGVSTVPEGLQLRQAGIRLPILKLSHAFPEEMEAAVRSGLPDRPLLRNRKPVHQKACAGEQTEGVGSRTALLAV